MQPFTDEEVIKKRGYAEASNDSELLDIAKQLTNNWEEYFGKHSDFRHFDLNAPAYKEKLQYLTNQEFNRLCVLQNIAIEKYDELYNWNNFKDRPLSEDVIVRFLDRYIDKIDMIYGLNSKEHYSAICTKNNKLKNWKEGQIIEVDSISGEYLEKTLYSDGSIKETIWKSD